MVVEDDASVMVVSGGVDILSSEAIETTEKNYDLNSCSFEFCCGANSLR